MAVNVAIGIQRFDELIEKKCFYIDKTDFIREWWESNDSVTLINRPRRFGKTLNMSMVEQFFSVDYADRGDLFEGCLSGIMKSFVRYREHIRSSVCLLPM